MLGQSTRSGGRLLLALLVSAGCAVGATGCATVVPGVAAPAPGAAAPAAGVDGVQVDGPGDADALAGIRWERVADPESGAATVLPGPVSTKAITDPTGATPEGVAYYSALPPDGLRIASMQVLPDRPGEVVDLAGTARATATAMGGRLVSSRPVTVLSRPAMQARYEVPGPDGGQVALVEFVDLPGHRLALVAGGEEAAPQTAEAAIRRMTDALELSSPTGGEPGGTGGDEPGGTAAAPTDEGAIYQQWTTQGWTPTPWALVRDPDSGVSGFMLGEPTSEPPANGPGVGWRSTGAPNSIISHISVSPRSGPVPDLRQKAAELADSLDGTLVTAQPTTMAGHPAIDVRVDFRAGTAGQVMISGRIVMTPTHTVTLHTYGFTGVSRTVEQVQQLGLAKLSIP